MHGWMPSCGMWLETGKLETRTIRYQLDIPFWTFSKLSISYHALPLSKNKNRPNSSCSKLHSLPAPKHLPNHSNDLGHEMNTVLYSRLLFLLPIFVPRATFRSSRDMGRQPYLILAHGYTCLLRRGHECPCCLLHMII